MIDTKKKFIRDDKLPDLISGLLFVVIGVVFFWASMGYTIGTSSNMGPGFFPGLMSALLIFVGVLIFLRSIVWKS
jgi:hypothetical protein